MSSAITATPSTLSASSLRVWQTLWDHASNLAAWLSRPATLEQEALALTDLAAQYEAHQPGFADDLRAAAARRMALSQSLR
jgi:hypothetical protein